MESVDYVEGFLSDVFLKHYLVMVDKNGVGKRLSAIT